MEKGKCVYLFLNCIYLFLERREERERNINEWLPLMHSPDTGDLAGNPGLCPDWESNQQPFGLQSSTQSTEPHQPGWKRKNLNKQFMCFRTLVFIPIKQFSCFSKVLHVHLPLDTRMCAYAHRRQDAGCFFVLSQWKNPKS